MLILRLLTALCARVPERARRDERGQSTAEYALVICAAAAVAGLLMTWVTHSGGLSKLFSSVIGKVLSKIL